MTDLAHALEAEDEARAWADAEDREHRDRAERRIDPTRMRPVVLSPNSGCNTPDDVLIEQVKANIRRGLPQVQPHDPSPHTALLVCGGPSLEQTLPELVASYWAGAKIVAVNGAYQWCIDRNLKPSAAVMLDAREFNARFVATPVVGCKYLIASQCHPATFDVCRERESLIWHACSMGDEEVKLIREYYFNRTYPVTMGTTVGVRSISLLRTLGFTHIEIFGLDSCWLDGAHHGYGQPENDRDRQMSVWLRPQDRDDKAKQFNCAPWHIKQAQDFLALIKERGDLFQLIVHGPGLIATIMRTGAEIQMEK